MERSIGIEVLFQDIALLVINKPAGLATLPDGYNPSLPHVKSVLEPEYGRLWIVHRLDKDTSGVLLLARSAVAHRHLNTQFEQHQVSKVYHAILLGNPEWKSKIIDLPLRVDGDRQHRTIIDAAGGKPAVTRFKVLERFKDYSLVEAIPETGRTHQIRAHLSALGFNIIGDKLYGRKPAKLVGANISEDLSESQLSLQLTVGIGLHAKSLEVTHPLSGERVKFKAPYSEQFVAILQQLRSL